MMRYYIYQVQQAVSLKHYFSYIVIVNCYMKILSFAILGNVVNDDYNQKVYTFGCYNKLGFMYFIKLYIYAYFEGHLYECKVI